MLAVDGDWNALALSRRFSLSLSLLPFSPFMQSGVEYDEDATTGRE